MWFHSQAVPAHHICFFGFFFFFSKSKYAHLEASKEDLMNRYIHLLLLLCDQHTDSFQIEGMLNLVALILL